ncbi:MAG TPA: hypothetical protein VFW02_06220 [Candidatus Limnocylindrales bacterium]|nr:hypothetical protein [Candidatus Limnocylindrales bacterium]
MDPPLVLVQFVHVAGGAAWFGGSLFANLVLLPFVGQQAPERQRELIRGIVLGPERVMIAAALTAAVTGMVRGIAFGPIRSLGALATPYGVIWLASVLVALAVFATGARLTSPAARALRDDDRVWMVGSPASAAHAARLLSRLRLGFRLELLGIAAILALMVLLANV